MANLPRWIDDDRVDSQAMLSAYMGYLGDTGVENKEQLDKLPMVVHKSMFPEPVAPSGVQVVKCTTEDCQRCAQRRGGYKFRWFSLAWYDRYLGMARPGAWTLGESDHVDH